MEYIRGRTDQARVGGQIDPPVARAFRAAWLSALRAGQMVFRRKSAALGLRAVLAQGRRVDLDRSGADREGRWPTRCDYRAGGTLHRRYSLASRHRRRICAAGLRGFGLLGSERVRTAAQCRSVRSQDRRPRNARAHGADLRAWLVESIRLCVAGSMVERGVEGPPLEERKVAAAARQTLSGAGRFPVGVPAAARRTAVGAQGGFPVHYPARSERAARPASDARAADA